eukprot:359990-Chlamydomonas_euryale.AAC.3
MTATEPWEGGKGEGSYAEDCARQLLNTAEASADQQQIPPRHQCTVSCSSKATQLSQRAHSYCTQSRRILLAASCQPRNDCHPDPHLLHSLARVARPDQHDGDAVVEHHHGGVLALDLPHRKYEH